MKIDIEKILSENSPLIDKEIEKVIPRNGINNLNDAVWYHLGTGGKRLRPVLAIITCKAFGGDVKKVLPFAAACELIHSWFLIHDDIEDGDRVRRDKPAVWIKYGLDHGINVGDYISEKVYELILKSKDYGVDDKTILKLMEKIIETTVKTGEGQALDMNLRKNNNPTEEEYMNMITHKTAYYLTVPMVGGAIVAGADDKIIKRIIEFGSNIGPAFQIADDLLDLTKGKGRGEIGSDIKEGKRSILVAHCASKCRKHEKKKLFEILNKDRERTTNEDILWVRNLFEKYGSMNYARKKAEDLIKKAKSSINDLPKNVRDILYCFADYMIQRKR